ncbi:uncharacterized protein MONBRDRAFT_38881 [Monosiga brevicollis MX1]|uniref:C2H2-type domain-containing protein n=1 Tax=Monosiga brevicollis TaxID=81824 RepID=A9VAS4_MONBE|nr:uncharacterized protein MONBRDRAFT_38881 [Monosiga brevicollis MX1]EDQ85426.1 predicted protein [Monosiga brevicollis MX1]|eukprot:XP_001749837.1 hypothetical protein [Monosiga brevicollis MX1]
MPQDKPMLQDIYSPRAVKARQAIVTAGREQRLEIFCEALEMGQLDNLHLDTAHEAEAMAILSTLHQSLDLDPDEPRQPIPLSSEDAARFQIRVDRRAAATNTGTLPSTTSEAQPATPASSTPNTAASSEFKEPGELEGEGEGKSPSHKGVAEHTSADVPADDASTTSAQPVPIDPTQTITLHSPYVPDEQHQSDILTALRSIPGFRRAHFSKPSDGRRKRMAWATFFAAPDVPTHLKIEVTGAGYIEFRQTDATYRPIRKGTVTLQPKHDLELARLLAQHLDQRAWNRAVCPIDDAHAHALSHYALYLRLVHSYDLYGQVDFSEEHLRCDRLRAMTLPLPCAEPSDEASAGDGMSSPDAPAWHQTVRTSLLESAEDTRASELGAESPERARAKLKDQSFTLLDDNVCQCRLCEKKFRGAEFVRKHLDNKHAAAFDTAAHEAEMYRAYLLDRHRPHFHVREPVSLDPAPAYANVTLRELTDAAGAR